MLSFPSEKVTLSPRHPLTQIHDGKQVFLQKQKEKRETKKERKKNNKSGTGREGGVGGGGRVRESE